MLAARPVTIEFTTPAEEGPQETNLDDSDAKNAKDAKDAKDAGLAPSMEDEVHELPPLYLLVHRS